MGVPLSTSTESPFVNNTRNGGVVTLTMARGDRYNPLSTSMIAALQDQLDAVAADPSARVIILAAEGKGFSAGHDLREMLSHAKDKPWQDRLFADCARMMVTLTRMPQPVIARVHGIATAAGCQLMAMCDLAVAADTAQFALPGVNIGVFCSTPAVGVARSIGRKRTMEMLLTGRMIDAQTALSWSLVNRVVPVDQIDPTIREYTDIILNRSSAAIRIGKQTFYQQIDESLGTAYDTASEAMACNILYEDAAEGMDAFIGKRQPIWRGR
jgi:enoyl-CoA hydratase/carnithine racemase